MNLTPVQATLIATVVTTIVTTSTVAGTHLLTRTRERRHLIWNRRMDAYGAAVQSIAALARIRQDRALRLDSNTIPDMTALELVGAQVEMFGSPQITNLWKEFFAAATSWSYALGAIEGRLRFDAVRVEERTAQQKQADDRKRQADDQRRFHEAQDQLDAIDTRLIKAIKREARFRRPR
ncbi:hypothetical protein ACFV5J_38610 [Streptomyces zaomyceticus]|uniref:hypothetical protein n=1 Tax=Streptomyces zaomyceticus TaxID=68286 RepID=UPI00365A9AE2